MVMALASSTASLSDIPLDFPFFPTDSELMSHLWNKIRNPSYDHPGITVHDVYIQEPWLLPWDSSKNRFFHGDERYFFLQRNPLSGKDNGAKRAVGSGRGWWQANATDEDKTITVEGGRNIGSIKFLTFFVNDEKKQRQRKGNRKQEGVKTDWIMHEYVYTQKSVKEWVLCKIRYNGKDPLFPLPTAPISNIQPAPQQCGGPDLQLSPFCGGPDLQLPASKRRKICVTTKGVQEQYALTLYNEKIKETGEMINSIGFEWSEVEVGGVHQEPRLESDCSLQQQQQQQPTEHLDLKEYDSKELKIASEALGVSPLKQQKQEKTLEECDDIFAEELEPKLEIKSEPAEQLQPLQQPPEKKAEGDCEEELLENFDFSQLPLDDKEFALMENEFGTRSVGDLWDDVWDWREEEEYGELKILV